MKPWTPSPLTDLPGYPPSQIKPNQPGLAQDLAFGTARWQPRLALIAEKLLQKPFKATAIKGLVGSLRLNPFVRLEQTRSPESVS